MSFFSVFKKSKNENAIILDIGSGSVAGAIVQLSDNSLPKIVYAKRSPIKFLKTLEGSRFRKNMLKSLSGVLTDLNKNGLKILGNSFDKNINKIFCTLASPWFISQTRTACLKRSKPFIVTKEILSDLIQKEEDDFEKSHHLLEMGRQGKVKPEVIERKMIDIKLNGYKTKSPLGKKTSEIEFDIFFSLSQEDLLDDIEEIVGKHFLINKIDFHSFVLVAFSAIRDMYEAVSNFLVLDITGEVTDISLVKHGKIVEMASFPLGKNSILRSLAIKLKITPREAASLLKLFLSKSLNKSKMETLAKTLKDSKELWSKELQKALVTLSKEAYVPSTVFFTSDEDTATLYSDIIKSEQFVQFSMTDSPFIVSFINCSSLGSYAAFRSNAEKDTFIAIEAIFFNRLQ